MRRIYAASCEGGRWVRFRRWWRGLGYVVALLAMGAAVLVLLASSYCVMSGEPGPAWSSDCARGSFWTSVTLGLASSVTLVALLRTRR